MVGDSCFSLHMPAHDREGPTGVDLGVTNKFQRVGTLANTESVNKGGLTVYKKGVE